MNRLAVWAVIAGLTFPVAADSDCNLHHQCNGMGWKLVALPEGDVLAEKISREECHTLADYLGHWSPFYTHYVCLQYQYEDQKA